jgi:hypothetical protein
MVQNVFHSLFVVGYLTKVENHCNMWSIFLVSVKIKKKVKIDTWPAAGKVFALRTGCAVAAAILGRMIAAAIACSTSLAATWIWLTTNSDSASGS